MIEKIKKKSKNFMKKASCIILTLIILLSSCITTTFAYDGEAPSKVLTANDLKEYTKQTYLYYNRYDEKVGNLPVYSPFNLKTMDAVMSVSLSNVEDGFTVTCEPSSYFAITRDTLSSGVMKTTYIIPSTPKNMDIWGALKLAFTYKYSRDWVYEGWNSLFYELLSYAYSESSSITMDSSGYIDNLNFSKCDDFYDRINLKTFYESLSEKSELSALVYTVDFKKDGTISNISYGGFYEDVTLAFASLGSMSGVSQISMYSNYDTDDALYDISSTPLLSAPVLTDTVNLNQYISTSTYSLTAVDYFSYTEDLGGSSVGLDSSYYSISSTASLSYDLYFPSHFLKEEYRDSDTWTLTYAPKNLSETKTKVYSDRSMYAEGKSWLFIPYQSKSTQCVGGYFIEFADGTNPIFYLKLLRTSRSSSPLYAQLVSKVDFSVYGSIYNNGLYMHDKIGTFDAATSTYTASKDSFSYANQSFNAVDFYSDCTSLIDTSITKYPSLRISGPIGDPSLLPLAFGVNCVSSVFPLSAAIVGFYYYISPENMPDIIGGSDSFVDFPDGPTHTPGSKPDDWNFTPDWDNLYTGMLQLELPEYPDLSSIFDIELADFWQLPEKIVEYIVAVVQWFSEAFNIFISTYAEPVSKIFALMGMVFERIPGFLRFIFIYSVVMILAMKILQYSTCSVGVVGSIRTASSPRSVKQSSDDKKIENEKEKRSDE